MKILKHWQPLVKALKDLSNSVSSFFPQGLAMRDIEESAKQTISFSSSASTHIVHGINSNNRKTVALFREGQST